MNFPKIVKTFRHGFQGLDAIVNPVNQPIKEIKIASHLSPLEQEIVDRLWRVEGMTQAKPTHFLKATPLFMLKEKMVIKIYQNLLKVTHIFVANKKGEMLFGGYIGWIHNQGLESTLEQIRQDFRV
jgi:hypothetical protein